jgi:hypothetical protein
MKVKTLFSALVLMTFLMTALSFVAEMRNPIVASANVVSCQDGFGLGAMCISNYPNCDENTSYCCYLSCGYEYECFAACMSTACPSIFSCTCGGAYCGLPQCQYC